MLLCIRLGVLLCVTTETRHLDRLAVCYNKDDLLCVHKGPSETALAPEGIGHSTLVVWPCRFACVRVRGCQPWFSQGLLESACACTGGVCLQLLRFQGTCRM